MQQVNTSLKSRWLSRHGSAVVCSTAFVAYSLLGPGLVAAAHATNTIAPNMPVMPGTSTTTEAAKELKDVDIEEKLGSEVPLDAEFTTSEGKKAKLSELMLAGKPTILTLNYYECPMLCTLVLNGLTAGIKALGFQPGQDYQVLTLSIAPGEAIDMAAEKKKNYIESIGRPIDPKGWTFMVGDKANIDRVADAVGFHYRYDADVEQYAHGAAIFVLTPDGRVARVLYGIEYQARDLRLALLEAAQGKLGSAIDKVVLYCFHYDPAGRKYALVAMNAMRVGGGITVILMGLMVATLFHNERRKKRLAHTKIGQELKGEI